MGTSLCPAERQCRHPRLNRTGRKGQDKDTAFERRTLHLDSRCYKEIVAFWHCYTVVPADIVTLLTLLHYCTLLALLRKFLSFSTPGDLKA